jgi:prefoldin alpha subunit
MVAQINILESYEQALASRISILSQAMIEGSMALEAVQSLPESGTAELVIPIGGGLSLPVTSSADKKIMVRVGDGVTAERSKDESIEFLNKRLAEFQKGLIETQKSQSQVENSLAQLRDELNKMASKQNV